MDDYDTDDGALEEYEQYLEYQDDPDRDAGEAFQDKWDMYRNEH